MYKFIISRSLRDFSEIYHTEIKLYGVKQNTIKLVLCTIYVLSFRSLK